MQIRKMAFLGVMTTLALVLSYVESLIPVFVGIPGVKLGLANLVSVFLLYKNVQSTSNMGCPEGILYKNVQSTSKDALLVSVMRILLSGFLFGNMMSILFSLTGSILSILTMALLKKAEGFSMLGVSIAGACMHNIGQLIIAFIVVQTAGLLYYFPFLMVSGVITGLLIGIAAKLMLRYVPDYHIFL